MKIDGRPIRKLEALRFGQPVNWIAAEILLIKDGLLVEDWDVIQDQALPMFGDRFAERH
jgi:hypothetical protein